MDRLCVFYEKLRRVVWQGIRVSAVCTACYGWWGVIYPELAMLPSTYEIVYEEQAEKTKTVQKAFHPAASLSNSFFLHS